MTKEDVLKHLKIAKHAHTRLLQKAKILIDNIDIEEHTKPINSSETDFGIWFNSDGQRLSALSNNPLECMQNIKMMHTDLYEMYSNIYNIYCEGTQNKGFFSKVLGLGKKEVDEDTKILALEYYEKMNITDKGLFDEISRLERRLVAISDEKIESLV
ncbi:hypothetical protein JHD49_05475 [Sulfurimonas sp. SAG-AH-194-C21]|nr:hypothetical protein [Sulfurimonas sp. SAG-AH-194-C21]MDF1883387.1 hypothetical protein [Sulfurimonas sp. SAG-AH-194-C21]